MTRDNKISNRENDSTVLQEAIAQMNDLGERKQPFLFIIDYDLEQPVIKPLPINDEEVLFKIGDKKSEDDMIEIPVVTTLEKQVPSFERYKEAFQLAKKHLYRGDSFLVNLTLPTEIKADFSLLELYHMAKAPYKLYYKDKFVVFSPETFIKIKQGKIHSYPMKGTIDASLPDAESVLLNNKKERAEHLTMVDLIRNDLSYFAKNVRVEKLCYLDLIKTNESELWQMSSEICGDLQEDFNEKIGEFLFSMLPAGSISGAPKDKTRAIIDEAEGYKRGFYTGVFGYFDGESLDSAVMIRFVEKINQKLFFKSGGGITAKSDLDAEYQELIQKVYVPID
ncbi:MAG TPA: aminodeoxychorismate synthase component I [Chitinophagaceae bacterium]|nr:aminodeoxychorismate synthase component I [Chitinophagaceae bacterium]